MKQFINSIKNAISILLELTKFRITFFVTITTFLGYILYKKSIDFEIIWVILGVLILSGGSAIFNHYQERNYDKFMDRTKNRPIPSGRVSPFGVLVLGLVFSLIGIIILYTNYDFITSLLGVIALIWYNLIYTPLKRITSLAVVPGSIIGSLPPMIGWVAAGGYVFDPNILMVAFFFFIWQVPHFWLLMLFFDEDYKKAGYPTLTQIFSREQIFRLTFIWIISLAVASLLIPFYRLVDHTIFSYGFLILSIWLIASSFILIKKMDENKLIKEFRIINLFVLLIVIQLSVDKLI